MKWILFSIILCVVYLCSFCAYADSLAGRCDNTTSRSFMFIRPAYEHIVLRDQLWDSAILTKKGDIRGSVQAIAMYQHSRDQDDTQDQCAKYFLINNKSTLLVSGDANGADRFNRDVRAEWLGLPSNFRGFLTVHPEQWQVGAMLEYNQDLGALIDFSLFNNSHVSIIAPLMYAENDLHLTQSYIENPGTIPGLPRDILEAFQQTNWCYDRIEGKTKIFRLPEIRFQFWRTFMDEDDMQLACYSALIIPTGSKPSPVSLFHAAVGSGNHVGLNAGVIIQVQIIDKGSCGRLAWFLDLDGTYRFPNHQLRTYDLKQKPWSRFIPFVVENNPNTSVIPGVNVLTIESKVRSYGLFDFVTGFRYKTSWGSLEASYNAWGHSAEEIKPRCPAIFDKGIMGTFTPGTTPASASASTIATQAANDSSFITISKSDLNIHSASAANAWTNALTLAGGVEHMIGSIKCIGGFGVFVEWSARNHPLHSWGAWGKCGISF